MSSGTLLSLVLAAAAVGATLAAPALADDAACIAASESAIPLRKQGKLHGALKPLAECAAEGCPAEVRTECIHRIEEIKAAMPTLILGAKDGAGNDLTAVEVTLDGTALPGALDGRALELDPGEHTFRFTVTAPTGGPTAPPPLEKKLVLRQGEKDRRESVVLGPVPLAAAPTPPVVPTAPRSTLGTRKTLAIVSAGIGVVGLGLGAVFGAYAISSQSREKSDCSPAGCSSYPQGVEDYNTAQKDATGSTVALAVGGALVATGVVLWVTAPRQDGSAASARAMRITPLVAGAGRSPLGLVVGVDL